MPQKKSRPPAHQNKFAFTHNPKSKVTKKILELPNRGACQRCYDKIEWRKKYRKYKPLTQPTKCNRCQKRTVKAAYHTICIDCAKKDSICEVCVKDLMQLVGWQLFDNCNAASIHWLVSDYGPLPNGVR